jgi:hypothetical protein
MPPPSRSGQLARNSAGLRFNAAAPLRTGTTVNTLDDRAPTSSLVVENVLGGVVELSWSAVDTEQLSSGEFERR